VLVDDDPSLAGMLFFCVLCFAIAGVVWLISTLYARLRGH
jgi:hypothetical protein